MAIKRIHFRTNAGYTLGIKRTPFVQRLFLPNSIRMKKKKKLIQALASVTFCYIDESKKKKNFAIDCDIFAFNLKRTDLNFDKIHCLH